MNTLVRVQVARRRRNEALSLDISANVVADDKRPPPPYRKPAIEAALGLHLVDYSVELEDLIDAVQLQATTIK